MDSFWKGSFQPIVKHVDSVKWIDFYDMTVEDWLILDYPKLRPAARVQLEKQIEDCEVTGFYRVTYDKHLGKVHGGKERYYYPASSNALEDAAEDKATSEFGNFENYADDVEPRQSFQTKYKDMNANPRSYLEELALAAGAVAVANWPRWALVLTAMKYSMCDLDPDEEEELEDAADEDLTDAE